MLLKAIGLAVLVGVAVGGLCLACRSPAPPPQDAGHCTVVVVPGVDAGNHGPEWGY